MAYDKIFGDDALVLMPSGEADTSVIFLHGLGADGADFEDISDYLHLGDKVRFILPHAPKRPLTLYGGEYLPAWYDIAPSTAPNARVEDNLEQMNQSAKRIVNLIDVEFNKGMRKVLLGGFSQGACLSLWIALNFGVRLSGCALLSGYVSRHMFDKKVPSQTGEFFVSHGDQDPVIDVSEFKKVCTLLEGAHINPFLYQGIGHGVCAKNFEDLSAWIKRVLA